MENILVLEVYKNKTRSPEPWLAQKSLLYIFNGMQKIQHFLMIKNAKVSLFL